MFLVKKLRGFGFMRVLDVKVEGLIYFIKFGFLLV